MILTRRLKEKALCVFFGMYKVVFDYSTGVPCARDTSHYRGTTPYTRGGGLYFISSVYPYNDYIKGAYTRGLSIYDIMDSRITLSAHMAGYSSRADMIDEWFALITQGIDNPVLDDSYELLYGKPTSLTDDSYSCVEADVEDDITGRNYTILADTAHLFGLISRLIMCVYGVPTVVL